MKFWGFSYLDVKKQKINSILNLKKKKVSFFHTKNYLI